VNTKKKQAKENVNYNLSDIKTANHKIYDKTFNM
jgi:hypothetical protein